MPRARARARGAGGAEEVAAAMAEASPQPGRYFCHCCSVEIVPRLPDYICPRCESGFIEELPEETRSTENGSAPSTAPPDQGRQPFENVDQHLFTLPQGYGQFAFGIIDDSFEIPTFPPGVPADDSRDPESRREREQQSRHRYGARQPRARLTARRATGRHEGVPTLEGIIQQLVNGIITPATIPNLGLGPWGVLHSNPMDYAWGANGLDAIITQVREQGRAPCDPIPRPECTSQRFILALAPQVLDLSPVGMDVHCDLSAPCEAGTMPPSVLFTSDPLEYFVCGGTAL